MKRTMAITVYNHTAVPLVRNSDHLTHGKWTDGDRPTPVIKPGANGSINSQKETGAAYGTEGYCKYVLADSSDQPTLEIGWSKPYHGESSVNAAILTPDSPYTTTTETVSTSSESVVVRVTVNAK